MSSTFQPQPQPQPQPQSQPQSQPQVRMGRAPATRYSPVGVSINSVIEVLLNNGMRFEGRVVQINLDDFVLRDVSRVLGASRDPIGTDREGVRFAYRLIASARVLRQAKFRSGEKPADEAAAHPVSQVAPFPAQEGPRVHTRPLHYPRAEGPRAPGGQPPARAPRPWQTSEEGDPQGAGEPAPGELVSVDFTEERAQYQQRREEDIRRRAQNAGLDPDAEVERQLGEYNGARSFFDHTGGPQRQGRR